MLQVEFLCCKKEAKPVPIAFCQPHELSDYHTLGLYSLRLFHETTQTHYIVPQYDYINFNIGFSYYILFYKSIYGMHTLYAIYFKYAWYAWLW